MIALIGAILGMAGAFLVGSKKPKLRFLGFTSFTLSNCFLIFWSSSIAAWPIVVQQSIYILTSLRGMRNNHDRSRFPG